MAFSNLLILVVVLIGFPVEPPEDYAVRKDRVVQFLEGELKSAFRRQDYAEARYDRCIESQQVWEQRANQCPELWPSKD